MSNNLIGGEKMSLHNSNVVEQFNKQRRDCHAHQRMSRNYILIYLAIRLEAERYEV